MNNSEMQILSESCDQEQFAWGYKHWDVSLLKVLNANSHDNIYDFTLFNLYYSKYTNYRYLRIL